MNNFYNKNKPFNELPLIPPKINFDNIELLKLVNSANNSLFELKGIMNILPNSFILMSPLITKEAVSSSSIENINTTAEDVFKAEVFFEESKLNGINKEVLNYREAVLSGFKILSDKGFIGTNEIVDIQSILEPKKSKIRNISAQIVNSKTKKVIYTPPGGKNVILDKLNNFDNYFNSKEDFFNVDPLIRSAILHYQFEAIHPFRDGNGRTGRILIILYLVLTKRLDLPVLFISEYILESGSEYYDLLKGVTERQEWISFIKYILRGIDLQSRKTTEKINKIKILMDSEYENALKKECNLLEDVKVRDFLFSTPFYSIKTMSANLNIHRNTANKYFKELERVGFLKKLKHKKENFYYNENFLNLLK